LPGHGQSPALNPPGDYQAVILALSELISGIVDEPCVIFGNSVGGAAAICTTVTHPESVCGLFLESPAGGAISTAERENLRLCFNGLTMADATQAVKKLFSEPPWWIRINMHVVMRALQAPIVDHILKTIPLEGFSDQALEKISVPTLVVWGTKEMVLPRASLEFYRKNMPKHVKFLEPVGAGHAPYLENPLRSLKWLREFLQENFQPALKLVGTGK
jgi:pimeloyl-ACP methyl ester carboxylesterase